MSGLASVSRQSLLGLIVTMFAITAAYGQEPTSVQRQSVQQKSQHAAVGPAAVDKGVRNPHWQANACNACHTNTPTRSALHLRDNRSEKLCNACHESISSHAFIHPVGMPVSRTMLARMPDSFRKAIAIEKGKLGCRTCHDLTMTCVQKRFSEKLTNPRFFRGGPYNTRSDICYLCHDASKYQRLNPHDQLGRNGKVKDETCLICHKDGAKLKNAESISDVDFNIPNNLAGMCTGCHPYQPHPGGSFSFTGKGPPNHLVKPNARIAERMKTMAAKNGIVLPLVPGTNEIFCGTCHNPHQKGVIKTKAAAAGANSKNRLRMQEMCANCHDK